MPIVTSVWRRSSPSSRRNTATCRTTPTSGEHQEAGGDAEQPVAGQPRHLVADIGAEQIERAVREIDVAHQAEDQREAAGDQEVEAGQRDAVEDRADEGLLRDQDAVQPVRPDGKDQPRHHGGEQKRGNAPPLSLRDAGPRRLLVEHAHAVSRRRCSLMRGALWNLPSFMMARMRFLSCRMRTSAIGSPSTSSRSAR